MFGTSKHGFTFIELLVVIMILGIVATVVVPNLRQRLPGYQRKAFITEMNTLIALGWQNALTTQKIHRILFDFEKRVVRVEVEEPGPTEKEITYKLITQAYRKPSYEWPENIEFKNFFVDTTDELNKPDRKTLTAWFYIMPEGLSQAAIINVEDTSQTPPVRLGLVLNPFTAQLKDYDTFQKP